MRWHDRSFDAPLLFCQADFSLFRIKFCRKGTKLHAVTSASRRSCASFSSDSTTSSASAWRRRGRRGRRRRRSRRRTWASHRPSRPEGPSRSPASPARRSSSSAEICWRPSQKKRRLASHTYSFTFNFFWHNLILIEHRNVLLSSLTKVKRKIIL